MRVMAEATAEEEEDRVVAEVLDVKQQMQPRPKARVAQLPLQLLKLPIRSTETDPVTNSEAA